MGTNFASDKFNVKPDIMTMAKALTNGSMPMGAVCVKDEIYEAVTDNEMRMQSSFSMDTHILVILLLVQQV